MFLVDILCIFTRSLALVRYKFVVPVENSITKILESRLYNKHILVVLIYYSLNSKFYTYLYSISILTVILLQSKHIRYPLVDILCIFTRSLALVRYKYVVPVENSITKILESRLYNKHILVVLIYYSLNSKFYNYLYSISILTVILLQSKHIRYPTTYV